MEFVGNWDRVQKILDAEDNSEEFLRAHPTITTFPRLINKWNLKDAIMLFVPHRMVLQGFYLPSYYSKSHPLHFGIKGLPTFFLHALHPLPRPNSTSTCGSDLFLPDRGKRGVLLRFSILSQSCTTCFMPSFHPSVRLRLNTSNQNKVCVLPRVEVVVSGV